MSINSREYVFELKTGDVRCEIKQLCSKSSDN
jgi:hypothetical protein